MRRAIIAYVQEMIREQVGGRPENARMLVPQAFIVLSAAALALTGAAKLYGATGTAKIFSEADPLLFVNNRAVMITVAILELALAVWLATARGPRPKRLAVTCLLWLSANFLAYRLRRFLLGVKFCPCLGTLTEKLHVSPDATNALLGTLALFWTFGSAAILRGSAPLSPSASEAGLVIKPRRPV